MWVDAQGKGVRNWRNRFRLIESFIIKKGDAFTVSPFSPWKNQNSQSRDYECNAVTSNRSHSHHSTNNQKVTFLYTSLHFTTYICSMKNEEERYLTRKSVQSKFGVSRTTLYSWDEKGILVMRKMGGRIVYRESDVIAFLP